MYSKICPIKFPQSEWPMKDCYLKVCVQSMIFNIAHQDYVYNMCVPYVFVSASMCVPCVSICTSCMHTWTSAGDCFTYRGFYPKGGGEVVVKCSPIDHFKPVELITPGNITDINISSHVAGVLPIKVCVFLLRIVLCSVKQMKKPYGTIVT